MINQQGQYVVDGTDQVYLASTQAGQATSTALSTTQTGFTLYNPVSSGVNLVILQARIAATTAPAGVATLVWAANVNPLAAAPTTNTVLAGRSARLGNASQPTGQAYSATTLPAAPVVVRAIGGPVATGSVSSPYFEDNVNGALVVTPGCCVSINSLTTAISAVFSVTWREVSAF